MGFRQWSANIELEDVVMRTLERLITGLEEVTKQTIELEPDIVASRASTLEVENSNRAIWGTVNDISNDEFETLAMVHTPYVAERAVVVGYKSGKHNRVAIIVFQPVALKVKRRTKLIIATGIADVNKKSTDGISPLSAAVEAISTSIEYRQNEIWFMPRVA